MPSTKAKYTPMMTQSISLGCTSPPFLFVDGSARVRRGPRAATLIDAAIVGVRRIQRQELARHAVGPAEAVLQRVLAAAARTVGVHQDRKSTRLNSSHTVISYAVFCLKKKKKNAKK